MAKQIRKFASVILLGIGLAMLVYSVIFNIKPVFSENNDKGFATAEPEIVREVSRGGIKRDANGKLAKTYTGKPPEACPT